MAWLSRTTNKFISRASPSEMATKFPADIPFVDGAGLAISNTAWMWEPDLSAVTGFDSKYWLKTAFPVDDVTLMDASARASLDAAEETARLDSIADEFDRLESVNRISAEAYIDEFNTHSLRINAILDAIDGASNFTEVKTAIAAIVDINSRNLGQLKTIVRGKL